MEIFHKVPEFQNGSLLDVSLFEQSKSDVTQGDLIVVSHAADFLHFT